jgi:hypothetical protein
MASFADCPLDSAGITRTISVTNDRHLQPPTVVAAVHAAIPNWHTRYFDLHATPRRTYAVSFRVARSLP